MKEKQKTVFIPLNIISAAFIGLDIVGILQLLSLPSLNDYWLRVSLFSFSASLPSFGLLLLNMLIGKRWATGETPDLKMTWYHYCALSIGLFGGISGILGVIFYLSHAAGMMFLAMVILGTVAHQHYLRITRGEREDL